MQSINQIDEIQARSRQFVEDRHWQLYQSPKNLSMALIVEAAELVEHFQWETEESSRFPNEQKQQEIADELSDILIYSLRLADELKIKLGTHALDKITRNCEKYPIPS
jgi:dCTP diphosphatase